MRNLQMAPRIWIWCELVTGNMQSVYGMWNIWRHQLFSLRWRSDPKVNSFYCMNFVDFQCHNRNRIVTVSFFWIFWCSFSLHFEFQSQLQYIALCSAKCGSKFKADWVLTTCMKMQKFRFWSSFTLWSRAEKWLLILLTAHAKKISILHSDLRSKFVTFFVNFTLTNMWLRFHLEIAWKCFSAQSSNFSSDFFLKSDLAMGVWPVC